MIKILAKNYTQAVSFLCEKFNSELAEYDILISKSAESHVECLRKSIGCQAIIMIGSVGDNCTLFADTFGLTMFYDKFVERAVTEYCKLAQAELPSQHVMDKLCIAPEAFNHYPSTYGWQCTCHGEYKKTHVYMIADDARECSVVFDNYLRKSLFRNNEKTIRYTFKVFGLSHHDVLSRLDTLGKYVSRKCETTNLDSKIVLAFPPKSAKNTIENTLNKFREIFGDNIYANSEQSLAKTVVDLLHQLGKTLAVAESVTGGLITSSIVDISGASRVLYEGVVTYSIQSKCKRLGINPHFVDEYGVVSQQVAQEMAVGLRKGGCDVALSTTGFAGPTSDDGLPVGLCYVGLASDKGVSVYRNVFTGDRNAIRAQIANMSLFLVYMTIAR